MNLFRSVQAVAGAGGDGTVDWDAVAAAAKAGTVPGELDVSGDDRRAYAEDVRAARDRIGEVTAIDFDVPATAQVVNRHHWIDANVETFEHLLAPLEDAEPAVLAGVARVLNTGSMSVGMAVLARKVLGQYDPLLFGDDGAAELYFVHPNIVRAADKLDVDLPRFRRWIAFHEVAHAAEFGAAPWLADRRQELLDEALESMVHGRFDRSTFRELNTLMTAVEGYAELVMDRAFDEEVADLREKLDRRRRGGGPLGWLLRRFLGLGLKRQQYERGKAFFEAVVDERGMAAAAAVWDSPDTLPTDDELDHPQRWLARVDPPSGGSADGAT